MTVDNCNVIGMLEDENRLDIARRVYSTNALSPTINAHANDTVPKIIVAMRGRNPEHPTARISGLPTEQRLEPNADGNANTLTTVQKDNLVMEKVMIKNNTKDGYLPMEVGGVFDGSYTGSETRRGRVQEEGKVSPTICTGDNNLFRLEKQAIETMQNNDCKPGDIINPFNQTVVKDGVSPTLTTRPEGMKTAILPVTTEYRIRKLTPRECFRLMGVKDEDSEKMMKVNSNTQLYKQASNSIVVDVMAEMFRKLF